MRVSPGWRVVTSVALACALNGTASSDAASSGEADRLHELTRAFAAFEARDMDGRRWTADGLRGRAVVLDFWATWCPPCWAEIPWLRRIQDRFGPERVQVIGITLDVTDRRTLVSWLNRRRIDWPQVWDAHGYDSALAERFGVSSLPTSVLVGPDGRVVALNLRGPRLMSAVEAVLEEQ
ncbi:MAG TPA: TlpA disulfide reductase family protein [Vicinamibacterales bacterium]|nr:TlpA disulfide reductase family protein [Vicinamibacterales bacterium]